MALASTQIPLSSIILDESIYPRKAVDHRRVAIFAENIRDGIAFDPIEVEPCPDWPGRIPAQLIAHILRYFSQPGDLVLDPMAGGGVTPDTCLAMGRRCWAFDMEDRPDTRPEIEPFTWKISSGQRLSWPVNAKGKPDLIIFDPPYFDKKAGDYDEKSISGLSRNDYLDILNKTGWYHTHIIQAPLSSQRFSAGVVSAMRKSNILGVTSRYVIVLNQQGKG